MPLVVFESTEAPTVEVDAPEGARVIDLCDERNAPVPFSCRSASCGTCRVDVLGGGGVAGPSRATKSWMFLTYSVTTRPLGASPARRSFVGGPGRVRLRPCPF